MRKGGNSNSIYGLGSPSPPTGVALPRKPDLFTALDTDHAGAKTERKSGKNKDEEFLQANATHVDMNTEHKVLLSLLFWIIDPPPSCVRKERISAHTNHTASLRARMPQIFCSGRK